MSLPTSQNFTSLMTPLTNGNKKRSFSEVGDYTEAFGESLNKVRSYTMPTVDSMTQNLASATLNLLRNPSSLLGVTTEYQGSPQIGITQHLITQDLGLRLGDIVFVQYRVQMADNGGTTAITSIHGQPVLVDNSAVPGLNLQAVNMMLAEEQYKILKEQNLDRRRNMFHKEALGSVHAYAAKFTPTGVIVSEHDASGGDSFAASVHNDRNLLNSMFTFDKRAIRVKRAGVFTRGMARMPNGTTLQRIFAGTQFWLVMKPTSISPANEYVSGQPAGPGIPSRKVIDPQASTTDRVVIWQWHLHAQSGVMDLPLSAFMYTAQTEETTTNPPVKYDAYAGGAAVPVAIARVNLSEQWVPVDKERIAADYLYMRETDKHTIGSVEVLLNFGHIHYF